MASLNVSMPDDLRDFVDRRTREGGFSTPTEYVRSLIRSDRQQTQQTPFEALILKWFRQGHLSESEEASLPPGLLDRTRQSLEKLLTDGLDSGPASPMTDEDWKTLREKAETRWSKRANGKQD